jgi:hypothetical protein
MCGEVSSKQFEPMDLRYGCTPPIAQLLPLQDSGRRSQQVRMRLPRPWHERIEYGLGRVAFLNAARRDRQIDSLQETKKNFNFVGTFSLFGVHT